MKENASQKKCRVKRKIALFMGIIMLFITVSSGELMSDAQESKNIDLESPSFILMEAQTGTVLCEKNSDEAMAPASVTKIMTLLLTFEAIDNGQMSMADIVTVSEHAASMGGSQCFFEAGEEQTVEDMIKCIIIASGNDAAVAIAEKIAGSEEAFVNMMNEKARKLGMENTCFKNACGLDTKGHKMSARDIALMSRELIIRFPEVFDYSGIWMDSIVHKTRRGESRFDLVNTNKFLNMYTGATGLKTGYTNVAKYCMAATANRDGVQLIAVIMGADTKEIRNNNACVLLDYGYSQCRKYTDEKVLQEDKIAIDKGTSNYVTIKSDIKFDGILLTGENAENVTKKLEMNSCVKAPVKNGDELGKVSYYVGKRCLGSVNIYAAEDVDPISIKYALVKVFKLQFGY